MTPIERIDNDETVFTPPLEQRGQKGVRNNLAHLFSVDVRKQLVEFIPGEN